MYEYKDGQGERVTVRSTRTLERLLESGDVTGTTPFRLPHEPNFVAAGVHPAAIGVAEGQGMLLQPPPGARAPMVEQLPSEPPSVPVTQTKAPTTVPASPTPGVQSVQSSPWVLRPQTSRAAHSQPARLVPATHQSLTAGVPMNPSSTRAGGALKDALVWQAVALLAGVVAYGVAIGFGATALAPLLSLLAIALTARHGARRMTSRTAIVPTAAKWIGAIGGGLLATLAVGPFGIVAAGAAVAGLIWGAKSRGA